MVSLDGWKTSSTFRKLSTFSSMVCSASLRSVRAAFEIVKADLQRAPGHLRPSGLRVFGQDGGRFGVLQIEVGDVDDPVFDPDFSGLFHWCTFSRISVSYRPVVGFVNERAETGK